MGIQSLEPETSTLCVAVLRALRDRPNSDTDILGVRLRLNAEDVEPRLQALVRAGLACRGLHTQVWNLTRVGRQLLELVERDPDPYRRFDLMVRRNTAVAGL